MELLPITVLILVLVGVLVLLFVDLSPGRADKTSKHEARELLGRAVGEVVKVADILGGTAGPLVEAQAEMAAIETEDAVNGIDGRG